MNSKKIYNILFEETEPDVKDAPEDNVSVPSQEMKARKSMDSIDDQVDSLILRYEMSSIREKENLDDLMELSLHKHNLKYLIEQEEGEEIDQLDQPAEEPEAPPAEEPEAPKPVGSEKMDADQPGQESVPDLDIDAFAMRTVRLINNYSNLLRVEEAIVNRVKNFLDENYGDPFVSEFLDILDKQYGISANEIGEKQEVTDDNFAVGAFEGGTGGLGGGAA